MTVGPQTGGGQNSELDLSWNNASGSAGYDIQRKATGGTWEDITEVSGGATVSYHDIGLWDGVTYSYQISAFNDAGDSDFSSAITLATPVTLPIAPSGLSAVATVPGQIQLVWQNNAYNETGFIVDSSPSGVDGTWTPLNVDGTSGITTASGTTTYTDTGLAPSTTRYYEVMAHNAIGNSSAITAHATTSSHAVIPPAPAAPTILSITTEEGSQIITFQTNNTTGQLQGYSLDRSYAGNFGQVSGASQATLNDDGTGSFQCTADFGLTFTYRVIAHNAGGNTASSPMSAALALLPPVTDQDSPVFHTLLDGGVSVHLDMDAYTFSSDPQERPDSFHCEFWSVDDNGGLVTDVGGVTGTRQNPYATMGPLPPSDDGYAVILTLHNDAGDSSATRYALSYIAPTTTYGTPTLSIDDGTPVLSDGYGDPNFEYSANAGTWFAGDGQYLYIAPGVSAMIRAYGQDNEGRTSGYSNTVDVSADAPAAPTGLTATATGNDSVHLAWSPIAALDSSNPAVAAGDIGEKILIERSDDGGASYREVGSTDADQTSADEAIPIEGMTSLFRIRLQTWASNSIVPVDGYSAYSATASAKSFVDNPVFVHGMASATATTIHAVWIDDSEGEDGTTVTLASDSAMTNVIAAQTVGPDVTSCNFTGLTPGTTYYLTGVALPNNTLHADPVSVTTTALPTISVSAILNAEETSPDGNPSYGYFEFTRTGSTTQPLTVNYTMDMNADDAATPGNEYQTLSGSVAFGVGQANVLATVEPNAIDHVEANKTVTVNLAESGDYNTIEESDSATITVLNTDAANIKVGAETIGIGLEDDVSILALGFFNRPYSGGLSTASSDGDVLTDNSPNVNCSSDGQTTADCVTDADGSSNLSATTLSGSSGLGEQDVSPPVKVRVDTNHDGGISFDDAGSTSDLNTPATPFNFWLNTDGQHIRTIPSQTALENFTRVEVQVLTGYSTDPANGRWTLEVGFRAADPGEGFPQIRIFDVATQDFLYTTDPSAAASLVGESGYRVGGVNQTTFVPKATDLSADGTHLSFIFEGITGGAGALTFTFNHVVGDAPWNRFNVQSAGETYINLMSINQMYEHWTVGDTPGATPGALVKAQDSGSYTSSSPQANDAIVFVHGWRMQYPEKLEFANTAFRRLYWQGYKGRFYSFSWPTDWVSTDPHLLGIYTIIPPGVVYDSQNFNNSENIAWRSAAGLRQFLLNLDAQYGYEHVNVFAHSMGNIVVSEALRQQAQATAGAPVKLINTYVASQAAIAAEAFDASQASAPNNDQVANDEFASFMGGSAYFATDDQVVNRMVNFYNPLDYALNKWRKGNENVSKLDNTDYALINGIWYRVEHGPYAPVDFTQANERYEFFSYFLNPPSIALGAQANVGGPFNTDDQVDLQNLSGIAVQTDKSGAIPADGVDFTKDPIDHSAEFYGDNVHRKYYWNAMMKAFGISTWDDQQTSYTV